MNKSILYLVAAVAALMLGGVGIGAYRGQSDPVSMSGSVAPASTFVLLDASRKTTDDFKGRVTLVNFWATTCAVCVAEMPRIVATHNKYHARGFDTMAVAMRHDPPSSVVHYAQTRQLPFDVAIDNTGSIAKAWGDVQATPTTFVVNQRGDVVKRYVGEPDFAELHKLIESLLPKL